MQRSLPPNVGPLLLQQEMAFSSFPSIKGNFVGGKLLALTRLNRKEPGALLYSTVSNKKNFFTKLDWLYDNYRQQIGTKPGQEIVTAIVNACNCGQSCHFHVSTSRPLKNHSDLSLLWYETEVHFLERKEAQWSTF